jgi:hypothetical protein
MRKAFPIAIALALAGCSHEQPLPQSPSDARSSQTATDVGSVPVTGGSVSNEGASDVATDPTAGTWRTDLLRAALELSSLTAGQKDKIQTLVDQKKIASSNIHAAHAQLLEALADAVESGKANAVALAPKVRAVVTAIRASEPADRHLLEDLHATLSPDQRNALASRLEAPTQTAHQKSAEERRLGWVSSLVLSSAQESQIEGNVRARYEGPEPDEQDEMRAERMSVLEAFKGDAFVMDQVVPPKSEDDIERWVNHAVVLAAAATPVLTAEQRTAAASILRTRATRSGR